MELKEHLIFPNFAYTTSLTDIDTNSLEKKFLEMEKNVSGRTVSNAGGWQSNNIDKTYEPMLHLLDVCTRICQEVSSTWKIDEKVCVDNVWVNINRKYNYNHNHYHPNSHFSGVFYVKANSKNGNLVFDRPDIQEHYIDCWTSEYTQKKFFITPETNLFVLFPAYINHYVEQNLSNEPRISIAMNFNYVKG